MSASFKVVRLTRRPILIVIVNYCKAERLLTGLSTILSQTTASPLHVVVLDNSCLLREASILRKAISDPRVTLIISDHNLGYTRGVNAAVERSSVGTTADILLMSPDIIAPTNDVVEVLEKILENNSDIGIVGPIQKDDFEQETEIGRDFPSAFSLVQRRISGRRTRRAPLRPAIDESEVAVDWLQSSFMLISRRAWSLAGRLDERLWLFMSDIELCHRVWQSGYRVVLTDQCIVYNDGVRASGKSVVDLVRSRPGRAHIRDALVFFRHHFGSSLTRGGTS